MLNQNFVYLGIVIGGIGFTSYFVSTIRGKVKPNKVSFAMWAIAPLIAFFAESNQKVGVQSLLTLSVGIFPLLILLGSFVNKKADWKIKKFDLFCGIFSLVGLLFWYVTRVGNWAILFSLLADGFAAVPTIVKAYKYPETESAWPWLADSTNGLFTLLTVRNWDFATVGFPSYIFIINIIIFASVKFKLGKQKDLVIQ